MRQGFQPLTEYRVERFNQSPKKVTPLHNTVGVVQSILKILLAETISF
jgi:hypothetical protein